MVDFGGATWYTYTIMKRCISCKRRKATTEFSTKTKQAGGKQYLASECRKCASIRATIFGAKRTHELRTAIFDLFGKRCNRCGITDIRTLQIDHINGGGKRERKTHSSVIRYYKYILEHPNGYQILCANCNWIKKYENKE